jgi:hypothetical protein
VREHHSISFISNPKPCCEWILHLVIIDECFWINFRPLRLEQFEVKPPSENDELTIPKVSIVEPKPVKLWVVVKSTQGPLNMRGLVIKAGDTLQMGRVKLELENLVMQTEQ